MKSHPIDYLLTTLCLTVLVAIALGAAASVDPLARRAFGDYHVVAGVVTFLASFGVATALLNRLIFRLRPIAPGSHSMDSAEFTTWKLMTVLGHFGQMALAPVTPIFLQPVVHALYGARIGKDVASGGTIDTLHMVTIGDRVLIGSQTLISGSFMHAGKLLFGPVKIGDDATLGVNTVVFPDTEIGAGATLLGGSYLMPGARIPAGETWRGNPARKWTAVGASPPGA